jgi:hemoglobin
MSLSEDHLGKSIDSRAPALFAKLGGESRLRAIINTFVDRVFEDRMIGFFFRNADRARIKELEYQLIAGFLGANVEYRGRPLGKVHANHPIMGGHFARRRQILSETLDSYQVPAEIKTVILEHTDALRSQITPESGSGCDPNSVRDRVQR